MFGISAYGLRINVFEQQIFDDNVAFAVQMHFPVISICVEHGRHLPFKGRFQRVQQGYQS